MEGLAFAALTVLHFCEIIMLGKLLDRDVIAKVVVEHSGEEKDGNTQRC